MVFTSVVFYKTEELVTGNKALVDNGGKGLEALMRLALGGDKRAYAEVLEETARLLRPYLARRLLSASDVEDVLQETLVSIHKARHTYDGNRPYMPWAFAIARFRLQDRLRLYYTDKLRHADGLEKAEGIAEPNVTESRLDYELLGEEVNALPTKQASILKLLHIEGYTAKEAAEKLGMTETAVKVAAHRAYKILRKRLEHE